ncbi:MAG TPA: aldo/keto reductase, partial [Acidimicrobiales bacterium]|nr:aldo/keto reductase [Acidimicrobiales bacterium]
METRALGSLRVSVVGVGCNNFGSRLDQAATTNVVLGALEAGVTLFDTADIYGGTKSEVMLGAALGARRDEAIIATKFGMPIDD